MPNLTNYYISVIVFHRSTQNVAQHIHAIRAKATVRVYGIIKNNNKNYRFEKSDFR